MFDQVEEAAAVVRGRCRVLPGTAVVLGSGLGEFASRLAEPVTLPFGDVPHWPPSTVAGHDGELVVGTVAGRVVAVLSGRVHAYEGYDARTTAFAVRVMGRVGVRQIVLTNAAGGISASLTPGGLMIIDDHVNLIGNPLAGAHDGRFGPRFPDMSEVYSSRLRAVADEAASARDLTVAHGVYVGVTGPSYETPAEIRALRAIGADAVGMSTVPEAIAARHMGMEVLGISCITNMAAGRSRAGLSHDEVLGVARGAHEALAALLEEIIGRL